MSEIKVIDNFFPKELYDSFIAKYENAPMKYGWVSNSDSDHHGHWNYPIHKTNSSNLADISSVLNSDVLDMWNYTKKFLQEDVVLLRCYINGHTYGVDGYLHKDSKRMDETTTVLYMNPEWHPNWAGETILIDKDDRSTIAKSILPKPNRMLMFPSNIEHAARGVSRKCITLRQTFMFKFRKKRSENFEKLSKFLYDNNALNFKHQNGSLHDHLVRVYQILETRKFPEHVCFGGGLHSVFGTNAFQKNLFVDIDNLKIINNFGHKAFELSKLFSSIDRPKALENPEYIDFEKVIVKLNNEANVSLPIETYKELCSIECANLLDQNSLTSTKYPVLKQFWDQNV